MVSTTFFSKLSKLRTVKEEKEIKEKMMPRRKIKFQFFCINCIQIIKLKHENN